MKTINSIVEPIRTKKNRGWVINTSNINRPKDVHCLTTQYPLLTTIIEIQ